MNPPQTRHAMRKEFANVLRAMCRTYGIHNVAAAYDCSDSQMWRLCKGRSGPSAEGLLRLAEYYSRRGDNRIASLFVSPATTIVGRANGEIDDEVNDAVIILSHASQSHRKRDAGMLRRAIRGMQNLLPRFYAEADRLENVVTSESA